MAIRTKNQLLMLVAIVLSTLLDVKEPAPECSFYMAFGHDIDLYQDVRGLLVASDLVTVSNNALSLTAKGMVAAATASAALVNA